MGGTKNNYRYFLRTTKESAEALDEALKFAGKDRSHVADLALQGLKRLQKETTATPCEALMLERLATTSIQSADAHAEIVELLVLILEFLGVNTYNALFRTQPISAEERSENVRMVEDRYARMIEIIQERIGSPDALADRLRGKKRKVKAVAHSPANLKRIA